MRQRFFLLTLVGGVLAFSHAAFSDELTSETAGDTAPTTLSATTVTATRTAESVDEVPATVSVISARQIEDELATDIKALVRFEPGVAVRSSPTRFTAASSSIGRDGNSGFNIRGLEGNRVLMLVDGVRVPDAFTFGAQANGRGDYVDLGILKSVEILRGPASSLYGSDGLAGAVSFTTKDPGDFLGEARNLGLRASVGYASADDSRSEGFAAATRSGPWEAMLAYTRRDVAEQKNQGENDAANNSRTTPNPQDAASNAILAKLIYRPNDMQRWRLTLDHFDRRTDTNVLSAVAQAPLGGTSTLALNARDNIKRDRVNLDNLYEGKGGWLATAQTALYYQRSRTQEYAAEDRNTAADRTRDNTFNNSVEGLSLQLTSLFSAGDIAQHLVYGVEASRTRQEGVRDGTTPPLGETFPTRAFPTTDYVLAGLYVQDELRLWNERLGLYPALRYDYYSIDPDGDALFIANVPQKQHDSHLSPKLGAVLRISELASLFANYGVGFKAPSPSQVNNGFTNSLQFYSSISNPNLNPETSDTLEAGVRLRWTNSTASLTAFSGRYKDFIDQIQISGTFTPTDPAVFQYINRGHVRIDGAEARLDAQLSHGFALQTGASYARGTVTDSSGVDTPLNSVEPWKLVVGARWHNAGDRYGGELIATRSGGKSASRVDQADCSTPSCFVPPAFTIVDIMAWWQLTDTLVLRAGLFNITDEKYWWWSDIRGQSSTSTTVDAYTQPGRNASLSLTWRL